MSPGGKTSPIPAELLERYDRLIATQPDVARKGATMPYTSVNGHIEILDATGRETGQIAEDGTFLFGPVWSPAGDHLAYSGTTSGFHADLYTSRPDGTDRRRVTATPDNEIRVEWATD